MPNPIAKLTANPVQTSSHHTRATGVVEAINRAGGAPQSVFLDGAGCTHSQTPPKESAMTRIRAVAVLAILSSVLPLSAQAATTLEGRVHDAALKACVPQTAPKMQPRSYYGAVEDTCVYRTSRAAMAKFEAMAAAKTAAGLANKN